MGIIYLIKKMRSWGVAIGMMSPKFWTIYRKEGLMRTILRAKPYKLTHEKAGYSDEVAPLVGTDEFGNRYYEDFTAQNKNQRRWVEYADVGKRYPTEVIERQCSKLTTQNYHTKTRVIYSIQIDKKQYKLAKQECIVHGCHPQAMKKDKVKRS